MGEFFICSFFLGVLAFFFPIFVSVHSYADVAENRAWFAVSVYGLRVFGGYAEVRKEGIAVHLTRKFALLVPYDKMAGVRKKFEVTKGFQLYRYHQIVETGGAGNAYGVMLAAALQGAGGACFSILKTLHPFLSLKNGTVLSDAPCLKLTIRMTTVFNGLILALAGSKKILEAIINWINEKRSTASCKRQPSN